MCWLVPALALFIFANPAYAQPVGEASEHPAERLYGASPSPTPLPSVGAIEQRYLSIGNGLHEWRRCIWTGNAWMPVDPVVLLTPEPTPTPEPSPTPGPKPAPITRALAGFQDAAFGDSVDSVIGKLGRRFAYLGRSDDGFPQFKGEFGGYRACIINTEFRRKRLTGLVVKIPSQSDSSSADILFHCSNVISKRYGPMTDGGVFRYSNKSRVSLEPLEGDSVSDTRKKIEYEIRSGNSQAWFMWKFKGTRDITVLTIKESDEPVFVYVAIMYSSEDTNKVDRKLHEGDF